VLLDSFLSFFCLLCLLSMFAVGCGAPGEPTPPSPPIPVAITDLTARQLGNAVLLSFTLPTKSTLGLRLTQTPTLEVWRGSLRPDGTPDSRSFHLVDTVPGTILHTYVEEARVAFPEPVPADDLRSRTGQTALYTVRTRVSERKASANSNEVPVDLYPVPQRIETLDAKVTEKSIQLTWVPPNSTTAGDPLPPIQEFHVYRGELDPTSIPAAENNLHDAVWKLPLLQIGVSTTAEYQDSTFEFGKAYAYVVRSVIREAGSLLESGDSQPEIITPRDIFPPVAPQDIVAAVLPGTSPGTFVVDLSWAINLETDVVGYRVYRSESESERGQSLTSEPVPTPSFRDNQVASGQRYWYIVTAVDRAGNESAPSAAIAVVIP
ncbi:MAG: fibronectin type III domain-containing protein, partial [Candidatus Acidiferrum sp.]